ncbi:hypothetical protein F4803DRAFT_548795 [Xylaria telfairii]|nr:hypothetical protein F4803DRAFT_548795 [Xylaria telfairii]
MSFTLALQSLVFYIASCAPCHQAKQKHRIEQQAKRAREAKERDNLNRRGYQQPEPFSTNPYWLEEIRMGPHVDRKNKKNNPGQQHVTDPAGPPSSLVPPNPATIKTPSVNPTNPTATTDVPGADTLTGTVNSVSSWETMYADTSGANTLNSLDTVVVHALNTSPANTSTANTSFTNTTPATFRTLFSSTSSATSVLENENEKPNVSAGHNSDTIVTITTPKSKSPSFTAVEDERYKLSPELATNLPANWNHRRYQREDEELWGSEFSRTGHKLMDAIKHAGSSAGRFIESSLSKDIKLNSNDDDDEENCYFIPVNRPVNDYHPPIARRPPFKGTVQWMVQPPPPAKLMEGKVPVSRGNSVRNSTRKATPISKTLNGKFSTSRAGYVNNLNRYELPTDKGKETAPPAALRRHSSEESASRSSPIPEEPIKPRSRRPRRPRRFWEPERSSARSGWDDYIRPRPRGRFVNDPDAYDSRDYVKRPEFQRDGKTFIRPRLDWDCMPPAPDGFACYPVPDPVETTYREELGVPRWDGSDTD